MNKKVAIAVVSAGLSACVVATPAFAQTSDSLTQSAVTSGPTTRALPKGSIAHHDSPYWTWFGPRNWSAATGAYGITLLGPQRRYLDYGFSTVLCASATSLTGTVNNFFAAKRASFRSTAGLRRLKVKSGAIQQLPAASYGPNYFRQTLTFTGRKGKSSLRGELVFDYGVNDPMYCYSRNQARTAPANGYRTSIRQLRSMQNALAYFGPGASESPTQSE